MKKIGHWLNGIKLRYKLALFYVCFCFVPVMILFLFSFSQMRSVIEDKEDINLKSYLYRSVAAMDAKLKVYGNLADYIAFDQSLAKVFSREYETPYEQYEQVTQVVDPVLQSLKYFHDDVERITVYTDNGMVKHDTTIAPAAEAADEDWYQEAQLATGLSWHVERRTKEVCCARRMPTGLEGRRADVLCIRADYEALFAPYEQTLNSEYGIFITDKVGEVLYEGSRFSEENGGYRLSYPEFVAQQGKGKESAYSMICQDSEVTGWKIWLYQPADIAGDAMRPVSVMVALTVILCLFGAVAASFVVSRLVSRRIERLTGHMLEVEEGNLEEKQESLELAAESEYGDEIGVLYRSFAKMLERLRTLIQEVYVGKLRQKESEMKALQAQINPHFLYNTLDSIAWMCEEERSREAVEMVNALARLFRISISKGHELIPIEKEVEHARSYLKIQNYRYKNQFTYSFEVDEECLPYYCNKITLQPLIENAIYHGINRMIDEGEIIVRIYAKGEQVIFEVEDNGVGMTQEQCSQILHSEPGDKAGIGIKNVNDRIRIYFGEQYGLSIESELDEGTKIIINMPKIREDTLE